MLGGFLRKTSCLLLAKTLKARIFVMTDQLFSLLDNVSISSSAVLQHPLIIVGILVHARNEIANEALWLAIKNLSI